MWQLYSQHAMLAPLPSILVRALCVFILEQACYHKITADGMLCTVTSKNHPSMAIKRYTGSQGYAMYNTNWQHLFYYQSMHCKLTPSLHQWCTWAKHEYNEHHWWMGVTVYIKGNSCRYFDSYMKHLNKRKLLYVSNSNASGAEKALVHGLWCLIWLIRCH